MSRTNYIFIDCENVQETDLDRIAGKPVKVVLVLERTTRTCRCRWCRNSSSTPDRSRW